MGCGAGQKAGSISNERIPVIRTCYGETLTVKEKLSENYEMTQTSLGEGGFGKVCKGTNKISGKVRAIKHLPKSSTKLDAFTAEIRICAKLDHPHIVKLLEIYEDANTYFMVMEICSGGELFDVIVQLQTFYEKQASSVMEQALKGVYYMHDHGVCHRDLKPENFLLEEKAAIENAVIKIVDFGIAKEFEKGTPMTDAVGTPFYVSPQVLYSRYSESCDLWSLGVLLYILLCGYPPFNGQSQDDILARVKAGKFDFPSPEWDNVSATAKNLIKQLLIYEEDKRCTAAQALKDKWIVERQEIKDTPLESSHLSNLRDFSGQNKLKKAAKVAIARRLNEQDLQELKVVFETLDKDKNGVLTLDEVKEGIDKLKCGSKKALVQDLGTMMGQLDMNGNSSLDYSEFIAGALNNRHFQEEKALWLAFNTFDRDGSGKIGRAELAQVIGSQEVKDVMGDDNIEQTLREVDNDDDGEIDFKEFLALMRKQ